MKVSFKKRLIKLQNGRTLRAFADQLDIGQSTLHNYLKGRIPKADFLVTVCIKTGCDPGWLLGLKPEGKDVDIYTKYAGLAMEFKAIKNQMSKFIKEMEV